MHGSVLETWSMVGDIGGAMRGRLARALPCSDRCSRTPLCSRVVLRVPWHDWSPVGPFLVSTSLSVPFFVSSMPCPLVEQVGARLPACSTGAALSWQRAEASLQQPRSSSYGTLLDVRCHWWLSSPGSDCIMDRHGRSTGDTLGADWRMLSGETNRRPASLG